MLTTMLNASKGSPTALSNDINMQIMFLSGDQGVTQENNKMSRYLHPGKAFDFGLEQFTYNDKSDKTDCIQEGEVGHLSLFDKYSYYSCIEECTTVERIAACGCVLPTSLLYTPETVCGIYDLFFCSHERSNALSE